MADDPRTLAAGRCMTASELLRSVTHSLDSSLPRTRRQEDEEAASEPLRLARARIRRQDLDAVERLAAEMRREGEAAGLVEPATERGEAPCGRDGGGV